MARVAVDVALPHLDRPFDYLVPADLAEQRSPVCGCGSGSPGRLVDGYVLERADESEHAGRAGPPGKVVSPEPVLSPEILRLARAVADRYAGSMADVLRLAVPPRHARVEAAPPGAVRLRRRADPPRRVGPLRRRRRPAGRAPRRRHPARRLVGAARPQLA